MPISSSAPSRPARRCFCEKPVSLDAARIEACLKVVGEAKGKLMIGFNRRFDPSFADVKRRIEAGEVGAVELVTILSRDPGPPPVSYIERSGGLYRDMMIHDFDMARFLLGEEPVEVHAVGANLVDPAIGKAGDVDTAAVLLKTASGKIAQISNSRRATYGYDQRIEVHGSKGLLTAGNHHATTVDARQWRRLRQRSGAALLPRALRRGLSRRARRLRRRGPRRQADQPERRGRAEGPAPRRRRDRSQPERPAGEAVGPAGGSVGHDGDAIVERRADARAGEGEAAFDRHRPGLGRRGA